ncbi:MAG TPA: nuclear transport factor 2 family protein [Acidimicrobiales bacterium]|nr:nuclear transport factor 2 family protein [Acidimicrobiales bacterium]
MTTPSIAELWEVGDLRSLSAALSDDVTFSSPVADYHGREDATHLLALIPQLLEQIRLDDVTLSGELRFTALRGRVEGRDLEGLLRERHDEDGRIAHVTLFLRPYRSLTVAIKAMGRRLAESPLPSARS